jgi:hypothetical protein
MAMKSPEVEISARVLRDDRFREALVADPARTLESEYGVKVPDGVKIQVHLETENEIHLVLPGHPSRFDGVPDGELEDTLMNRSKTGCCTCGSTTEQSLSSLQAGCGC